LMGLLARLPIAQAPGMGNNHFFITVVMSLTAAGITNAWQVALGIVFFSGLGFLLLSLLSVREAIINALSPSLRAGIAVGIGLFIAFIGLRNGGLIVPKPGTVLGLATPLFTPGTIVFSVGFLLIAALHAYRVRGSILIGILASTALALALGLIAWPKQWLGFPDPQDTAILALDLKGALTLTALPFLFVFLFMDLFDTVGTLVGVAERGGFMKNGQLPNARRALLSDATGTMVGALLGTSTVTSYIESSSGVEQGGRTGLVNLVVAACFLLALFFAPLIALVASYPPITASALVMVGVFMCSAITRIDWDDYTESIPAFIVMLGIPLTYSIGDGLALGFLTYAFVKLLSGRARQLHWIYWVLGALMLLYFTTIRVQLG
jgi:adenine/guanine/hypoxanthine permease